MKKVNKNILHNVISIGLPIFITILLTALDGVVRNFNATVDQYWDLINEINP